MYFEEIARTLNKKGARRLLFYMCVFSLLLLFLLQLFKKIKTGNTERILGVLVHTSTQDLIKLIIFFPI